MELHIEKTGIYFIFKIKYILQHKHPPNINKVYFHYLYIQYF